MKLIKQTSLAFRRGSSDKVYEVDLCDVGRGDSDDQYVVNFRYGRRGATLRDGTKTPLPVGRAEADKLFDKLVSSKTSKGYQEVGDIGAAAPAPAPTPASAPAPAAAPARPAAPTQPPAGTVGGPGGPYRGGAPLPEFDARGRVILERLRAGEARPQRRRSRFAPRQRRQSSGEWPLDRVIWRAGELGLAEAESTLLDLLREQRGEPLRRYCVVWALGRLGSEASIPLLRTLYESRSERENIRALCAEALRRLYNASDRRRFVEGLIDTLPPGLRQLAKEGDDEAFSAALARQLQGDVTPELLSTLYLIDNEHTRPGFLEALATIPLDRKAHRWLRRLFKAAEFRNDGRVFGILAWRIEKEGRSHLRLSEYFRRRIWRTLRTLGDDGQVEDFTRMAVGVLLPFSDDDGEQPRSMRFWDWRGSSRQVHWGPFASYWAFNQLLYQRSDRFHADSRRRSFRARRADSHDERPSRREEAFPSLWDRVPMGLLHLLDESACAPVHHFAATALRQNRAFCSELDADAVVMLLSRPYAITAELGFDLAERLYDANHPDHELVAGCALCAYEPARRVAMRWIDADRARFVDDGELMAKLVCANYEDTRRYARDLLRGQALSERAARLLIVRVIAELQDLSADEAKRAEDVVHTLTRALSAHLQGIGAEVLGDLLTHPLTALQVLAAEILIAQARGGSRPSDELLLALLGADAEEVRAQAVRLLGELPDGELIQRPELLFSLATHALADLRQALRPLLRRLGQSQPAFGERFAAMLVESLVAGGLPEGVPSHITALLRDELLAVLPKVDEDGIWRLLQSPMAQAQELGGVLLGRDVEPATLSIKRLVALGSHEILSVRQGCWRLCEADVERLKRAAAQSLRLCDAKWEDTRQWAFGFVRDHFGPEELTPPLLVAIADSVRADVMAFGRELITRFFDEEHGAEYLLKLAEHPTTSLQLYASNYLERFAAGNLEHLRELEPYFISVLSRVNQGRVAKTRVLGFLEAEAQKSLAAAELVARIFARQSVTIAIGDKAKLIEGLLALHTQHPEVSVPIAVRPLPLRGAGGERDTERGGADAL